MTALVNRETRTFSNGDGIAGAVGTRVKLSSGKLALCGLTEVEIGVLEKTLLATDSYGSVRLARDTERRVAASAIAQYANCYRAASGKVDDTATGEVDGIALEAASGDGSQIEVLPMHRSAAGMGAVTAGQRMVSGEATLDGSNPTTVATGLTTIVAAGVTLKKNSTPGDDPTSFSVNYTGSDGNLDIYAYKTDGSDPTLVASTNNSAVVCWWAVGT